MEKSENIAEVHSEEVTRILSRKPKWLIRNGMILTFSVFVVLAVLVSGVEVPVMIKVPVNVSRSPGKSVTRFSISKTLGPKMKTGQHLVLQLTGSGQYIDGSVSQIRFSDTSNSYLVQVISTGDNAQSKGGTTGEISAVLNDTAEIQLGYESLLRRFFIRETSN